MMIVLVTVVVVMWRRHPRHPILLMVIATTVLIWQDPIMNWAPYAVYNPQLWHWPETWPLVSLSPTVEPFLVIGYATFYMAPFFPAVWILRRLQARRPPESFVSRHPLVTLAALILAIGFVFDAALETFLVRTQLYIYSQVVPFGSFAAGETHQFPLIWESTLVTLVMIAAGVMLYRTTPARRRPRSWRTASASSAAAGAGHVPRHVRRRERRLLRLRLRLRRHPCLEGGDLGRARGPIPRRRSTTPTGSTRRRGSRVRSSPASGPVGRVPSRAGPTSTRPPTVAGAGEPPAGEPAPGSRASATLGRAPQHAVARQPAGGERPDRADDVLVHPQRVEQRPGPPTSADGPRCAARRPGHRGTATTGADPGGRGGSVRGRTCSAATRGARRAGCCTRR